MNVLIVGCGKMGADLAYRLYKGNHDVTIIDQDVEAFTILPADFQGRLIEGDVLDQNVLTRADIQSMDALACLTDFDSINMVVGRIAKEIYQVENVVVSNFSPKCRSLYEDFDLQVISTSSWGAQRLEEMIHHKEMRTVFSAGNGEVEVYEILVPDSWSGKTLEEIICDYECQLVALTRAGKANLPTPQQKLESGDILHVSATYDGIVKIREHLTRSQRGGGK